MRLLQTVLQTSTTSEIQEFSDWIVKLGDGMLCEPNDRVVDIEIPPEFLISDFNDPIEAIVLSTYTNLLENYRNDNFLQSKAILASKIETMEEINQYILSLIPGKYLFIQSHMLHMECVLYVQ